MGNHHSGLQEQALSRQLGLKASEGPCRSPADESNFLNISWLLQKNELLLPAPTAHILPKVPGESQGDLTAQPCSGQMVRPPCLRPVESLRAVTIGRSMGSDLELAMV